jgi:hypothetical protein
LLWKANRKTSFPKNGVLNGRSPFNTPFFGVILQTYARQALIERLLNEIRSGGPLEVSALAARMGTSPAMVEAMLEHLQRLGYIQAYEDACGEGCRGCSMSQACSPNASLGKIRLWKSA